MRFKDFGYERPHAHAPEAERIKMHPAEEAPVRDWWLLFLFAFIALSAFILFGCSSTDKHGPFEIVGPAAYHLAADSRPTPMGMCLWSEPKSKALSERFHIAEPQTMFLPERTPIRTAEFMGMPVAEWTLLGHYENGVIQVWMLDIDGCPIPVGDLQQTWKHEFVHHFDKCKGNPPPPGSHNELFEFRIRELDL